MATEQGVVPKWYTVEVWPGQYILEGEIPNEEWMSKATAEAKADRLNARERMADDYPAALTAIRDLTDALRLIRDNGPGLIAQHGDALDAGLAVLAKADARPVPPTA